MQEAHRGYYDNAPPLLQEVDVMEQHQLMRQIQQERERENWGPAAWYGGAEWARLARQREEQLREQRLREQQEREQQEQEQRGRGGCLIM